MRSATQGPMLARLEDELPAGEFLYEPKWDGFRCLGARRGDDVDLRSRNDRPLARYFPEIVAAIRALRPSTLVLDGELIAGSLGAASFPALLARLHPAESRVQRLSHETPAVLMVFDVLDIDGDDVTDRPFVERRAALTELLGEAPPAGLALSPATKDIYEARRWLDRDRPGVDGVIAKPLDALYQPGVRAMVKVKRLRTADCVVAGFRWLMGRRELGSLLLGLYRGDELRHVGVVSSFTEAARVAFRKQLEPLEIPLEEHPWANGFLIDRSPLGRLAGAAGRWTPDMVMDWVPLRIQRVAEVTYDRLDGDRFRHPARFVRWRPDRDPTSCTFEQLSGDSA